MKFFCSQMCSLFTGCYIIVGKYMSVIIHQEKNDFKIENGGGGKM